MKELAIIGASYLQFPLVRRAKELGYYTLCFAWPEGAVCKSIADEYFPISVVDKESILSICRKKQIDGICTIASDISAPTVAFVAENMGLTGNSFEAALRANNKFLMRSSFRDAGIPSPKFLYVSSFEDLNLTELSYPLIVKPTDRSGSLGVVKVDRPELLPEAVEDAIRFSFCHTAIVEEYIEGREISVEFISYMGKHYPLQITDKVTTGAPHFVELEHHQPAALSEMQYAIIYSMTMNALDALGITNGASHSEYKIKADGSVYIIEIGARMGGDFIGSDLVQMSTGYDYLKGVIEVALGDFQIPLISKRNNAGVYFLCEETRHLLPIFEKGMNPGIVRVEILDKTLHEVTCSADRSGYLIYQGNFKIV